MTKNTYILIFILMFVGSVICGLVFSPLPWIIPDQGVWGFFKEWMLSSSLFFLVFFVSALVFLGAKLYVQESHKRDKYEQGS